jgi:hypothetical protein
MFSLFAPSDARVFILKTIGKSPRLNLPIVLTVIQVLSLITGEKWFRMMFTKFKKISLSLKPKLFFIRWYPSSRSCVRPNNRRIKPQQMPPLMVRKAEWRR